MAVTSIKPGGAGPLMTLFTTPDFCAPSAWTDHETPALSNSICMPNGWKEYWNYKAGFYSPAVCPWGFTRACTIPESVASGIDLGGSLTSGETGHICCPTGGYTCVPGESWTSYSKCMSTGTSIFTASNEITPAFLTTTKPLVFAIQVRWQSSDLSNLATNPTVPGQTWTPTSTASAETRPTATAASTSSATAASNDDDDNDDDIDDFDDLSTGAKIGVVIGATVAAMAMIIGAYLFWRRRSKKRHQEQMDQDAVKPGTPYQQLSDENLSSEQQGGIALSNSPVSPLTPANAFSASTNTIGTNLSVPRTEMPGSTAFASELPASHAQPVEMPSNAVIAELPGDYLFEPKDKKEGAS